MVEIILIVLAPAIGGLIYGVERVVRARMQNRMGPPVLQPFYDMYKLIDKEPFLVNNYHVIFGILHFLTLWVAVALVILGGNLLYIVFIHLLASIFIVLAGFSVRSVFSHVGANRELLTMIAYEPILILIAAGFYILNGSFSIEAIRLSETSIGTLTLLFLAFLLIVPIKLKKSPFDAAEAHQEIVGGVEIEYSGLFFEFVYMAKWLEYVFIYLLLTLFAGSNMLLALALVLVVFLGVNLVDNATARVKVEHLVKITLGSGIILGFINLAGLYV